VIYLFFDRLARRVAGRQASSTGLEPATAE